MRPVVFLTEMGSLEGVRTKGKMMYSVAFDITKNVHDVEDIVQLSFIHLIDILYKIDAEEIGMPRCKN